MSNDTNWVYVRSEPGLWTVGFYHGDKWEAESDHDSPEKAAERVGYLNGSGEGYPGIAHDFEQCKQRCNELLEALTELCDCPQWVDEATVPKAGIEAAPEQVVLNLSVALLRFRKARAAIAKATARSLAR